MLQKRTKTGMVGKNPLYLRPRNNFRLGYIWAGDYESEVRFRKSHLDG